MICASQNYKVESFGDLILRTLPTSSRRQHRLSVPREQCSADWNPNKRRPCAGRALCRSLRLSGMMCSLNRHELLPTLTVSLSFRQNRYESKFLGQRSSVHSLCSPFTLNAIKMTFLFMLCCIFYFIDS